MINTDGAVFKQTQATGIGVVARDHEGQVIAAMSKKLWVPLGPLEAEVKAMEEGILFAGDVGLQDVIFECDSELLSMHSRVQQLLLTSPTSSQHACLGIKTLEQHNFHE